MPKYDYECFKCEILVEVTKKMSDPTPWRCPICDGEFTLIRHIKVAPSVEYKGKGWFKKDGEY